MNVTLHITQDVMDVTIVSTCFYYEISVTVLNSLIILIVFDSVVELRF